VGEAGWVGHAEAEGFFYCSCEVGEGLDFCVCAGGFVLF
jgi:hypothetical protein